jgi:hypothetical protein
MFSVDNFYDFLDSHYGWTKNKTMLWRFYPHGSKNFADLHPFYDDQKFNINRGHFHSCFGAVILHDQEPFMPALIDTYRQNRYDRKKEQSWNELTWKELFLNPTRSTSWPIFCHSETNSRDIQYLSHIGMIECYYFWHGLVARDWFRHWRLHPDLMQQNSWTHRFLLYARDHSGTRRYRRSVIDSLQTLKSQIRYNWEGDRAVGSDYSAKIVIKDACETAIHIVSETVFESEKIHLTEKVFKPMVMRQPFVLFAGPGSLEYLRKYGFRTFNSVWDESYDQETDHHCRKQKILDLIDSLAKKSPSEFQDIMQRCQVIIDHNREHFFSDAFEKILLHELHTNMQKSLCIQKQKLQEDPGGSYFHIVDSLMQRNVALPSMISVCIHGISKEISRLQPRRWEKICQRYSWAMALG